jgi:hypothetical protein
VKTEDLGLSKAFFRGGRHREKPVTNQRNSKKGTKNLLDFFLTISKPDVSLVGCPKFQRAVKKEE